MKTGSWYFPWAAICLWALVGVFGCSPKRDLPSKSRSGTGGTVVSQLFDACRRGDIEGAKATLTPDSITSLEQFFSAARGKGATVGWDQFATYIAGFNEPECKVTDGDKTQVQCTNLGKSFHFAIITIDQQPKIQLPALDFLRTSTSW